MELNDSLIGPLLIEGKTKRVHQLLGDSHSSLVVVVSKDRITAGDGLKAHQLDGKAVISTRTNCALFEYLRACGVPTHYVSRVHSSWQSYERAFVAQKCSMVPIEWVARRVATGSFLKRHPHVQEGTRFAPPKLETFFKDDANHDPFWSRETLEGAQLQVGGVTIGKKHVAQMLSLTRLVFELIERVWCLAEHALIDMKIEFGVTPEGALVVADVIDNDSWRLWPFGRKELMLDKQIYRNMKVEEISLEALQSLKEKFQTVAQRTETLFARALTVDAHVLLLLGSQSDRAHADKIVRALREKYGVEDVRVRVASAHKTTWLTLEVVSEAIQSPRLKCIVAVAGLSNGLGPVVAGNCPLPVINAPPIDQSAVGLSLDIWSSLRMPSGVGVSTCLGAENAALASAVIVGNESPLVWGKVRTNQTLNELKFIE